MAGAIQRPQTAQGGGVMGGGNGRGGRSSHQLVGMTSLGARIYAPASSPENWEAMAGLIGALREHAPAPTPTVVKVQQAEPCAVSADTRA